MTRPDARRILVVDDERDIAELLSCNLSTEGFVVVTACDGGEALEKLRERSFDLAVLDLMMPGMHGMELCRILRNDPHTRNLPIIMLSAKTEEIDRVLGLEMGADNYLRPWLWSP